MKTINGKTVKITKAGYLYVDGQKIGAISQGTYYPQARQTPLSRAPMSMIDNDIDDYLQAWLDRNWRMV